jgi:BirA family biotin operon repressor/biotin-[acetyl-CoA-carboxylase] ligase
MAQGRRILARMTLLTDLRDAERLALGNGLEPADLASLPSDAAWAWRTLAGDAPAWTLRGADLGVWNGPVVIVAHAPTSQFGLLQQRLAAGDPVPDALAAVALEGSRFRGQRGRAWATLAGNLHLSVHLTLDHPAAEVQAALAVLPAVATARAIERASQGAVRPGLKWVNDLLLADRKVGGVLSASHVDGARVRHLLLGIGVNVAARPELPATPRALSPARLADADPCFADPAAWSRLLNPLLEEIEAARTALDDGHGAALIDAYRDRAAFLGRRVTIWPVDDAAAEPIARGVVEALLPDLSLRIAGVPHPVRHGRMTLDPLR